MEKNSGRLMFLFVVAVCLTAGIAMGVPPRATNPNPADGATDVDVDADLSWTAGRNAISHDVNFGTSNPPPFIQSQTATTYDPGTMADATTYYWRIDEWDGSRLTTGNVWSFTTAGAGGGTGSWDSTVTIPMAGIHTIQLKSGRVLVLGHDNGVAGTFHPSNPVGTYTTKNAPDIYMCGGMTTLEDGRFFINGGEMAPSVGAGTFDSGPETWTQLNPMNVARWYPTTLLLGDGRAITFSGTDLINGGVTDTSEIWDPSTGNWTMTPSSMNLPWNSMEAYPRLHLLSDGKIVMTGQTQNTWLLDFPSTGNWTQIATSSGGQRWFTNSVRLLGIDDEIMIIGGGADVDGETGWKTSCEIINMSNPSPSWSSAASMNYARSHNDNILLPDGKIFAVGGYLDNPSTPEMYDPVANTWTDMAPHAVFGGTDHSTAILLYDGRVLRAGLGGLIQIYSPPYLSGGPRPTIISAPTQAVYGSQMSVDYSSSAAITSAVFIRPSPATHKLLCDQIGVPLNIASDTGSTLTLDVPGNSNLIPPGYYMLFILDSTGVPSVAEFVQVVSSPDTDPPTPDPMTWASVPSAAGDAAISMTATTASDSSGVEYYFYQTTANSGGSDSGWQDSTSYTDTDLNASTQYCYEVQARDKSVNQNLTAWSTNQCATTTAPDTTPPTPDPATWASVPAAAGSSQIDMTATTASDPSGVQYFFDETTGGGNDSGWQSSASYSDTGLSASTQYCYQVKARDNSANLNETAWSTNECATTQESSGWIMVNNTDAGITYSGSWTNVSAPGAYQNDAQWNETSGSASYTFTGTKVRVCVWDFDFDQSFDVYIDDVFQQTVSVGIGPGTSYLAYESGTLSSGGHTIRVDYVSGEVHLDAFEYSSGPPCTATDCHVDALACETAQGSQGKKFGKVTVTIIDDCGDPVVGADVTGTFTGDFNEQLSGITNSSGVAVITTTTQIKKPTYQFCVDNVVHTLPYDSLDNVVDCCNY